MLQPGRVSHGESGAPQRPEGLCLDGRQEGLQDHRLSQVWQACQKARGAHCLYSPFDEERFDEPVHVDCAIVIQLGDYKMMSYLNSMMGLTELVIPPKPDGYASRRELSEAVEQALDAPLPALAVEMFKLVRERFPRETDAWLSIYSGGMPWIDMPATGPLKTMDEIARMSVRDFYVDQCCDAVVVTEVTEDTVTALCDYGS